MGKSKINWHLKPACACKKDLILDRYKHYLEGIGLRKETVILYLGRVGAFLDRAKSGDPSSDEANKYRSALIEMGYSRSHINNTCFAIKKFLQMNEIAWSFNMLKPDEGVPYYFDENDVIMIFNICSNIKHLAMLQTLFYGCLRSSELCRLDDKDLDLKGRMVRLRETKGGRDDIAYINLKCVRTLESYLKIRPQKEIGDRIPLFYTDKLNFWTKKEVHRMFLYYKAKAGIKKPGAVHVFSRHTTATLMIAKGCDSRIVKELLRHRDIRTKQL